MKKNQVTGSRKKPLNDYLKYSGIAVQMVAIILAGVYAGIWLDEKVPMKFPLFKLVLSLFSVGFSMYIVIRGVSRK